MQPAAAKLANASALTGHRAAAVGPTVSGYARDLAALARGAIATGSSAGRRSTASMCGGSRRSHAAGPGAAQSRADWPLHFCGTCCASVLAQPGVIAPGEAAPRTLVPT
jgi:hypothetical protein